MLLLSAQRLLPYHSRRSAQLVQEEDQRGNRRSWLPVPFAAHHAAPLRCEGRHGMVASQLLTAAVQLPQPADNERRHRCLLQPASFSLAPRHQAWPLPIVVSRCSARCLRQPLSQLGSLLVETPNGSINGDAAGILQIPLNSQTYPNAQTVVLAGYELRDSLGNAVDAAHTQGAAAVYVSANRDINFKNSGIIASNAKLDASGSIYGFVFSGGNLDIQAQQNVNVTALGVGNVSVSSGGTISGTIVGVGSVSVSGSSVDAALISANVSGTTSGQSGLGQGTAANSTSQAAASEETAKTTTAAADDAAASSDLKKKTGKPIALAQKVSRVTVLLPPKY